MSGILNVSFGGSLKDCLKMGWDGIFGPIHSYFAPGPHSAGSWFPPR